MENPKSEIRGPRDARNPKTEIGSPDRGGAVMQADTEVLTQRTRRISQRNAEKPVALRISAPTFASSALKILYALRPCSRIVMQDDCCLLRRLRDGRPDGYRFGAQIAKLLCRGFRIRRPCVARTVCRMELGDTADWQSGLQPRVVHPAVYSVYSDLGLRFCFGARISDFAFPT